MMRSDGGFGGTGFYLGISMEASLPRDRQRVCSISGTEGEGSGLNLSEASDGWARLRSDQKLVQEGRTRT